MNQTPEAKADALVSELRASHPNPAKLSAWMALKLALAGTFTVKDDLGDRLAKAEARIAALESERATLADSFKGGFLPGTIYARGDIVQRQDATWLCLRSTTGEPGNSGDWRLLGVTR